MKHLLSNFIFKNPDRIQTIQILILSGWFRFRTLILPMRWNESFFGKRGSESSFDEEELLISKAYLIGKRVERICNRTPWDSKCLVRALTAQALIKRKHIKTTLYLGIKENSASLEAHAWLRCGEYMITGGDGFKNFDAKKGRLDKDSQEYSIVAFFLK